MKKEIKEKYKELMKVSYIGTIAEEGLDFGIEETKKIILEKVHLHFANYCNCKALDKNCIDVLFLELKEDFRKGEKDE